MLPLSMSKFQRQVEEMNDIKAGPFRYKQPTNKLKIRILSQTSILYLIRHASVILIVGLHI